MESLGAVKLPGNGGQAGRVMAVYHWGKVDTIVNTAEMLNTDSEGGELFKPYK